MLSAAFVKIKSGMDSIVKKFFAKRGIRTASLEKTVIRADQK